MTRTLGQSAMPKGRNWRRRLAIGFTLVAAAVAILFVLVVVPRQARALHESWERELASHADVYEAAIEIWVLDRLDDARTVAANPHLPDILEGRTGVEGREHVGAILTSFAETQGFDDILVFGLDGRAMSMRGEDLREGTDPNCAAAVARSSADREARVEIHRHVAGSIAVAFVCPIMDATTSRLAGAVVLETSVDRWLYPFFVSKLATIRGLEALLVVREGESVRYLTPLVHGAAPPLKTLRSMEVPGLADAAALEGKSLAGSYLDYRGVSVRAATRPIEGTRWALVVKTDAARIDRAIRERVIRSGTLVGLALVATGALFFVMVRAEEHQALVANARLAAVLKYANDAVLFLDREGRIEEANRMAEQLYERSRSELCALTFADLRAGSLPEPAAEELRRVESTGKGTFRAFHRSANGVVVPVEISSRFVEAEGIQGFIVIVRDVSAAVAAEVEVRRLNEELEHRVLERTAQLADANLELESFAYSVSHDLRAPLRAIDGFTRILLDDHSGKFDDEGRRLLGVVVSSARRMGRLIDDLLEFSRAGRRDIRKSRTEMGPIVRGVIAELDGASPSARLNVRIEDLPPASCDPTLIRQVWVNLLTNAVKFSSSNPDGLIEIGARREERRTIYFVRDQGVGFDMKYVGKLFGVFQRLHAQIDFEGTGVGLALVQRIVKRHGGEAWAEGELGRGATFYFSLPDDAA